MENTFLLYAFFSKMIFRILVLLFLLNLVYGCSEKHDLKTNEKKQLLDKIAIEPVSTLSLKEANRLSKLPLHCIQQEYPNKLNQTLTSDKDLSSPKKLHPSFYGCFDWHSSVHGHWSLVKLLKKYPDLEKRKESIERLKINISAKNIVSEVAYFKTQSNKSFERTYGWAWLLKLAEELHTWDSPEARSLEQNLQPLTDLIVNNYLNFLPKLHYPIRIGEHTNTAFGLTFAYDYANSVGNNELKALIEKRAIYFYLSDQGCPITWEPGGFDFLSPCLEEADIMRRVLPKDKFSKWLKAFLPALSEPNYNLEVGVVSDRSDGKLAHLDGVNFSRAWCLKGIAKNFPAYEHLTNIANKHLNYSLRSIVDDNYEGTHWLGSFAIYSLD